MEYPQYIVANSRNLAQLVTERNIPKADVIITSPPYYDVKNYDDVKGQIGHSQRYGEYIEDVVSVLQQCYEVSKANATLWLVMDTVKRKGLTYPIPFDINRKLNDLVGPDKEMHSKWLLRDIIIWNRAKNLPWHARGRLKHEFEYILFFSKKEQYKYHLAWIREIMDYKRWWLTYPERYNMSGRPPSNVWEFSTPIRGWGNSYQEHLCPFPFPLVERILLLASDENDVVLDPFAGSGSVIAMATQMGRRAVGVDINPKYEELFQCEVLRGAQKYWDRRQVELSNARDKAKLFMDTNIKLRKIKFGVELGKVIQNQIDDEAVILVLDSKGKVPAIDLTIVQVDSKRDTDISNLADWIEQEQKKYKVKVSIHMTRKSDLAEHYYNMKLFGYLENRIYKYDVSLPASAVITNVVDKRYVFSDIKIRIDNAESFLCGLTEE